MQKLYSLFNCVSQKTPLMERLVDHSTGAVAKKSQNVLYTKTVVLLKNSDCQRRDGRVYMPTTIEMAKIKKPNTGQYKTNVQFSTGMSEEMVRQKLQEAFPTFDLNGR